jgi:hypothetical protein
MSTDFTLHVPPIQQGILIMLTPEILEQRAVEPSALFAQLEERARDIYNRGKTLPLLIVDLDDTLLDKRPRVMKVLSDLIMDQNPEIPLTDDVRAKIAEIKPRTMKYDLKETLQDVGVDDETMLNWLLTEFKRLEVSDQYIMFDLPIPGSVDFIKGISTAGAMTMYLGGLRNMSTSKFGTERSISMYELPAPRGEVGALFMSEEDVEDDMEFKRDLLEPLSKAGEVIAVFDNEPSACNLFKESFPDAAVVLVDTSRKSDDDLVDGISVIKNFIR